MSVAEGDAEGRDGGEATSIATSGLVHTLLDAEAERRALQEEEEREVLFADDLLPGVGGEEMTLRQGLAIGGLFTFTILVLLQMADELETAVLQVLAPNIRDSFGVSDGVIVFISAAGGAFIVLGALPMGYLADRFRRGPILGWAAAAFAAAVFSCGLAINAFTLFLARFGVGVAKSANFPVQGSLIADGYPIGIRGRMSATITGGARLAGVLSPVLVGGIAALAGGPDGWRWAYLLLGLPVLPLAYFAFRIPEPPRGQFEKQDVLGEVFTDKNQAPISVEAAFARLHRIKTYHGMVLAFAALGFGLFTGPVLQNLYLEDHFGLESFGRGVVGTANGLGVLLVLPFFAVRYDGLFRRDPTKALRLLGALIIPVGIILPIQYAMPNAVLFTAVGVIPSVLLITAFTMVLPVVQSVVPYRLRGMGTALGGDLHVLHRGHRWGAARRVLHRRPRPGRRGAAARRAVDDHRRLLRGAQLVVDPQRSLVDGRRAARGARGAPAPAGPARGDPGHPGQRHRLLLRPGPGAVRRRLRGAAGRGARAAGHERSRQVDDPAGDRGSRHAVAGRGPAARHGHHLRGPRAAGEVRHPAAAGRQGRLPAYDHPREPRDGGLRLPERQRGLRAADRPRARAVQRRWPTARTSSPRRCPAGSSRCWRWPSPCCTTPTCC